MRTSEQSENAPNALINEHSPYLLQHAYNPVQWLPWGEAAFTKAAQEDKPLFVSIGYATCHWCHVMERESFEDVEIAELLNKYFVPVKVDREERPDVDALYMAVCQAATGHGGWPLSAFLTPDKKPFFVGTYFPKENRQNRPGFKSVLQYLHQAWQEQREKVVESADNLLTRIKEQSIPQQTAIPEDITSRSVAVFARVFDKRYAGFSERNQFPSPHNLLFLLEFAQQNNSPEAASMALQTLQAIRCGGIYDHIGGGVHRYSTDKQWLLPHFEKMLYDQAGCAMAFCAAGILYNDNFYKLTAQDICNYVLRDMTSPEGLFYSAEDADSEGVEGKFYVWEYNELSDILSTEADGFAALYNARTDGNYFEEATGHLVGDNILHLSRYAADGTTIPTTELQKIIDNNTSLREKLFAKRIQRIRPLLDDKSLADWNGFMIAALARCGSAFGKADYIAAAERAFAAILRLLRRSDGRLLHRYRNGNADIPAFLDDYAYMAWAAIELYTATAKTEYMRHAITFTEELLQLFGSAKGALSLSAQDNEQLPLQQREGYDGAYPSGNSVAAYVLAYCGNIADRDDFTTRAIAIAEYFADSIQRYPIGYSHLLRAYNLATNYRAQCIIAGNPSTPAVQEAYTKIQSVWLGSSTIAYHDNSPLLSEILPRIAENPFANEGMLFYLCYNFACQKPEHTLEEMTESLATISAMPTI